MQNNNYKCSPTFKEIKNDEIYEQNGKYYVKA